MKARGFSLLELLCTVAIIMILTVLLVDHGSASADKRARIGCEKNLQKIYLALSIYANDNEGNFPSATNAATSEDALALLVPRDTTATEVFLCPGSDDTSVPHISTFSNSKISYAYYMGHSNKDGGVVLITDSQVNTFAKTPGQPLFSANGKSPGNNHGKTGGNLLTLGGAVQFSSSPLADRDLPLTANVKLLNPSSK